MSSSSQGQSFDVNENKSSVGQSFDFQAQEDIEHEYQLQQELDEETSEAPVKWCSGMQFPQYGLSLYDYQAGNFDELSVFAGDQLEIVGDGDSEGWLLARTQTNQSGFIPQAYLATFQTADELHVYVANLEREQREAAAAVAAEEIPQEGYEEQQYDNQYEEQIPTDIQTEQLAVEDEDAVPKFQLTRASPTTEMADSEMKRIDQEKQDSSAAVSGELFAQALYDFDGVDDDEIAFLEGDVIRVLARDCNGVDDGYWYGELNGGRRGWFPSMVVEVVDSPNSEVGILPGELKSPEAGPPAFIPPPPVVLIEATPVPTPLDSPTGSRGHRNNQSQQSEEDADSGFGGVNQGAVVNADDTIEDMQQPETSGPQESTEEATKQSDKGAETVERRESEDLGDMVDDAVEALKEKAIEITDIVLSDAKEAIERSKLIYVKILYSYLYLLCFFQWILKKKNRKLQKLLV